MPRKMNLHQHALYFFVINSLNRSSVITFIEGKDINFRIAKCLSSVTRKFIVIRVGHNKVKIKMDVYFGIIP